MIEAFKKYQAAGFATLPTKQDKSPDVKGTWKGGIQDPEAYRTAHGIGIICGKLSGGFECVDFDNHFGDAKEIISEFSRIEEVKEIFTKYSFPIESTVSGGFHLIYRCSTIAGNQKLAQRPKKEGDRWRPDTIIETRGEGGYFCVDPTPGYKVIRNDITQVPEITPEEREILLSAAKSFNTWNDTRKNEFEETDRPGDIFNTKPEAVEETRSALIGAGWKELTPELWQRPGKKKGISGTLGKVAPGVFYNFSSNGHPFDSGKAYTPFQVIGLLKYNGDFKTFAKELAERYELSKPPKTRSGNSPTGSTGNSKPKETGPELEQILNKAYIDLEIPVSKPPVIMRIRDYEATRSIDRRLFTLGNFSAVIGKSKSKKTFLGTLFLASAADNGSIQNKIIADFPENKQAVLLFDTEQSRYDSYLSSSRIPKILGYIPKNFGAFDLREYSPHERCNIIEFGLEKWKNSLGFVVIDGIADLATAINDEVEASRVVSLLMRWTKIYNCHIHVVIHENKGDNNATGHLGSAIQKKAEAIISVKKDTKKFRRSYVSCTLIRGTADFNDFSFIINEDGLPEVEELKMSEVMNFTEPVRDEF
ncbi:MAG: bifunctional DNA primase/polymerase [Bacteroidales bacterium]|nr:bifunctional DNA primase/polymerase [Bacteroidales bacterium]